MSCPEGLATRPVAHPESKPHGGIIPETLSSRFVPKASIFPLEIAEHQDFIFYSRLIKGISQTKEESQNKYIQMENNICLTHIIRTIVDSHQSHSEEETARDNQKRKVGHVRIVYGFSSSSE
jgi:hypothetical protein